MGKYQDDINAGRIVKKWHRESDNHPTAPMNWSVCELCGYRGLGFPPSIARRGKVASDGGRALDRYCLNCNKVIECEHNGIHIGSKK